MPPFTKEILKDTLAGSVVKFTFAATGSWGPGTITSSIEPSELTGFNNGTLPNIPDLSVTKLFWSLPDGGKAVNLAFGLSGSITGSNFFHLNNSGYINFYSEGLPLVNNNVTVNRRGSIFISNASSLTSGDAMTIMLEVGKKAGFSITGFRSTM